MRHSAGQAPTIKQAETDFRIEFQAMATPCEVRLETGDRRLADEVALISSGEAKRVEAKFSRYRSDSVIGRINASGGVRMVVDAETASLLDCAAQCYDLSGGLFDITSGVLRRAWRFDGSDNIPSLGKIRSLLPLIGWQKVSWQSPEIILPSGMELDLGGLGKEYAVDRVLASVVAVTESPALVNFGGDLRISRKRNNGDPWNVAIESVDMAGEMAAMLQLAGGALATSGDARRFLLRDGIRYGHILNPKTGWPVVDPPRSITVAAATCLEAGISATIAMLHGKKAEAFLKREGIKAWCVR